jgi:hypothetical protein
MKINSGHERQGRVSIALAKLRWPARTAGRDFGCVVAHIAVAAALVTCSVALYLNRRPWPFTVLKYSSTPAATDPARWRRPCRSLPARLLAEMLVEKLGNLAERDGGLGQAIVEQVLRV